MSAGIVPLRIIHLLTLDSDEAVPLPPIEEEAQFEKTAGTPQEQSRISSESTRSSTSNIVDSVGRISLSSERSEEAPSQLQKSTSNDNFSIQNGTTQIPTSQANGVDITSLQARIAQLEQANTTLRADKQKSDSAYNSLLHKVNDIRKSLTTRFQQNEEQLAANSETIERLESENQALTETVSTLQTEITSLSSENSTLSDQVSALRRDLSTRQANEAEWTRERNKLEKAKRQLESEIDNLRLALTNWERTASEEHSIAESSRDRIVLLEEEIASYRDHQDTARSEAERYREEADKLRHALREGQEERKRELREVVEGMEAQIDRLNIRVEQAERSATAAEVILYFISS
jgi:chromosome segregation ATPase